MIAEWKSGIDRISKIQKLNPKQKSSFKFHLHK
jgi:hypothetical protein